ncbi:hypothetical protein [Priestia aryabhattai]|uniref:hypothetical protein n=1 Tax=Priestia aryabhattai TaxID=412384 RepID=UPI002E204E2A|nr:hypothetical protein [Priestia aryabhattai]
MNERNLEKEKLKLHFMYVVIILVLVNVMVGAFLLFGKKNALAHLSSAGTLLSIVLAIVAILITLWDVAGQKSNVLDVKNSVEDLKGVTGEITDIIEQFEKTNRERESELITLMNKFGENYKENSSILDSLAEKVEKLSVTGDDKSELDIIKDEILGLKTKIKGPVTSTEYIIPNSSIFKSNIIESSILDSNSRDNYVISDSFDYHYDSKTGNFVRKSKDKVEEKDK